MPENVSEQLVQMRADEGAADDLIHRVDEVRKGLADMRAEVRDMGRDLGATDDRLAKYGTSAARVGSDIDHLAADMDQLRRETNDAADAAARFDRALATARGPERFETQMRALRGEVGVYGDVSSRLSAFGGLAGGLGRRGAAEQIMIGADIADVVEAVPLFTREIGNVAERLTQATPITRGFAGALQQVIPGLSSMGASLATMGVVAGGAALAMWGLSEILGDTESALDKARETTDAWLESQIELDDFLATATTRDVQRRIEKLTEERDRRQENVDDLRGTAASLERQLFAPLEDWEPPLGFAALTAAEQEMAMIREAERLWEPVMLEGGRVIANYADIISLKTKADELQTETVDTLTADINQLTDSLDGTVVASNDAAAAQENLARQRANFVERQVRAEREAVERGETWTREQLEDRLDAIAQDKAGTLTLIETYGALADQYDWAAEKAQDLRDHYVELVTEEDLLLTVTADLIQAREDEADALDKLLDAATDFIEAAGDAAEEQTRQKELTRPAIEGRTVGGMRRADGRPAFEPTGGDITARGAALLERGELVQEEREIAEKRLDIIGDFRDDAVQIEADRALDLKRDAVDFQHDRTQALAEHYRDLADLDAQFYADRADLLEDLADDLADVDEDRLDEIKEFNKSSLRSAEDHKRRMIEIERDMRDEIEDAAARLDARSVISLMKQGQKRLRDEQDQYDIEKERREEDFQERLDELDELRDERLAAGQEALADLKDQHDQERQETIAAWERRIQEEDYQREVALQRQREDWAREDQLRRDRAQRELEELGYYTDSMLSMRTAHYDSVLNLTDSFLRNMVEQFDGAFSDIGTMVSDLGTAISDAQTSSASGVGAALSSIGGL